MDGFIMDGVILKFDGEDRTYSVTKWAQDIEDNAEVFQWTAQQKLIVARRSLTGTAELWLRTEKVFKTYEELKTALVKEFPDSINTKEMHEIMSKRKKRKDETYIQYMLVMKELGKRARFPDYVAIQYIIDGIEDYDEPCKVTLYGITQYTVLKEKLQVYESVRANKKMKPQHSHQPKQSTTAGAAGTRQGAGFSSRWCYSCGDPNHVASVCPNGLKCFKCNLFGHIGRNCTVTTAAPVAVVNKTFESSRQCSTMFGAVTTTPEEPKDVLSMPEKIDRTDEMREKRGETEFLTYNEMTGRQNLIEKRSLTIEEKEKFQMTVTTENDVNNKTSTISAKIFENDGKILLDTGSDENLLSMRKFECLNVNQVRNSVVKEEVIRCVEEYQPKKTEDVPVELEIILKNDVPDAQRPRRLSLAEQQLVEKQAKEWAQNGVDGLRTQKLLVVSKTLGKENIAKVHGNGHIGKVKMKDLLSKAHRASEGREEKGLQTRQQIMRLQDDNAKSYNKNRIRTQFDPGIKLRPTLKRWRYDECFDDFIT